MIDGFMRIEDLRWDAFNESTTNQQSVEAYWKAYGHYPARVLADTIFRTGENLKYFKEHGIHMNWSKLGNPFPIRRKSRNTKSLKGWNPKNGEKSSGTLLSENVAMLWIVSLPS